MAMKRCPDCGEKYSDTYKYCPFCEEEEILRENVGHRRHKRRVASQQRFSLLTPTLVVLILLMAGLLVYLLWGDQIRTKLPGGDKPGTEDVTPVQPGNTEDPQDPETEEPGVMPEEPNGEEPTEPVTPTEPTTPTAEGYESAAELPSGLTLNKTDYTAYSGDPVVQLTASGGSGTYRWYSQDERIAKVDSAGKVTAVAGGTVNILVTDGASKGICIVRVKGPSAVSGTTTPAVSTGDDNGSGGAHKLNREDFTLSVGEKFQLSVSGVTTALTWSIADSGVAAISSNGTVTGVSKGTTTATVSWDGQSLKCIVRVN